MQKKKKTIETDIIKNKEILNCLSEGIEEYEYKMYFNIDINWEVPIDDDEKDEQKYWLTHSLFELYQIASRKLQDGKSPEYDNIKENFRDTGIIEKINNI